MVRDTIIRIIIRAYPLRPGAGTKKLRSGRAARLRLLLRLVRLQPHTQHTERVLAVGVLRSLLLTDHLEMGGRGGSGGGGGRGVGGVRTGGIAGCVGDAYGGRGGGQEWKGGGTCNPVGVCVNLTALSVVFTC